jgi:hypothetical protein
MARLASTWERQPALAASRLSQTSSGEISSEQQPCGIILLWRRVERALIATQKLESEQERRPLWAFIQLTC